VDTNSSEIARRLTALGVVVRRTQSLPDDLALVTGAITDALARSRLVVTTGGLGPTPDDLTREAIAAACGEEPHVDPGLERWLEAMFARRGLAMSERNRKQAWLIPSGSALSNANGTASEATEGSSWRYQGRRARCARCGATGSSRGSSRAASAARPRP
jgi:nicotinamide-nucleotide amidase